MTPKTEILSSCPSVAAGGALSSIELSVLPKTSVSLGRPGKVVAGSRVRQESERYKCRLS